MDLDLSLHARSTNTARAWAANLHNGCCGDGLAFNFGGNELSNRIAPGRLHEARGVDRTNNILHVLLQSRGWCEATLVLHSGLHCREEEWNRLEVCNRHLVSKHKPSTDMVLEPLSNLLPIGLVCARLIWWGSSETHDRVDDFDVCIVDLGEGIHRHINLVARSRVADRVVPLTISHCQEPQNCHRLANLHLAILQSGNLAAWVDCKVLRLLVCTLHEVQKLHATHLELHRKQDGANAVLRRRHPIDLHRFLLHAGAIARTRVAHGRWSRLLIPTLFLKGHNGMQL
mmetsp:Transcript_28678/g.66524  ORF Transcript_28678/g.66524 Transcript_28678/m.66524 type:complete len:286 (-) Transcript_28678:36-893(-)